MGKSVNVRGSAGVVARYPGLRNALRAILVEDGFAVVDVTDGSDGHPVFEHAGELDLVVIEWTAGAEAISARLLRGDRTAVLGVVPDPAEVPRLAQSARFTWVAGPVSLAKLQDAIDRLVPSTSSAGAAAADPEDE